MDRRKVANLHLQHLPEKHRVVEAEKPPNKLSLG